jgi:hypothetical protein
VRESYGKSQLRRCHKLNRSGNSSAGLEVHLKIHLDAAQVDLDGGIDQKLVGDGDGDVTGDVGLDEAEDEVDLLLDSGDGWRDDTVLQAWVSNAELSAET